MRKVCLYRACTHVSFRMLYIYDSRVEIDIYAGEMKEGREILYIESA